jgi:hypothetical protein
MKSGKRDYFYFEFENNTSGWIRRKRNQFGYIYLLCLTPLSAYFSYIMATSFSGGRSREYPKRTTDHGQATGKLYHLRLRVECTLCCNLQSRALTHTVLVIGLYELLGNSTTYPIEPPGPSKSVWCGLT